MAGFRESIRVSDEIIARTESVGRNFTPSKLGTRPAGGREIGDDGPGGQGRESDYKYSNGGITMGKLNELGDKTGEIKEQGDQVLETGDQKLEEAEDFKSALDGLDLFDEDAQEIADTATEGAQEVASEQAEDAIREPMEEVGESLTEVSDEAMKYADIEHNNAGGVSEGSGDYSSVASQAESSFEQHAEEFEETSDTAQETRDEYKDQAEQQASRLDSLF